MVFAQLPWRRVPLGSRPLGWGRRWRLLRRRRHPKLAPLGVLWERGNYVLLFFGNVVLGGF